ncbi:MAG TPA: uroporphyrinogen-III synthase [Micromonosporaceae bacterium]
MNAPPPLAGFTVAVTADRRREELSTMLERRGARVVRAPAVRIVPLPDDADCLDATKHCLDGELHVVVATTGVGFRGWLSAADGWGLSRPLLARLAAARIIARGPKARGAVRAAGLTEEWSPESESAAEVLEHLLAHGVAGQRIAVQLHGDPQPGLVTGLRRAGADVITIPVYRWEPPADPEPLRRLVEQIAARQVDAITFTSAPAVESLLRSDPAGTVVDALRDDVLAACVGPVCSAPLRRLGVPTVEPGRGRLGALVRTVVEELSVRRAPALRVAGHTLAVRGHAVVLDGELIRPPPAPMAVLRELARRPGRVLARTELLRALPRGADGHAVEMAVARLRSAVHHPEIVQTVVKRGYRLRVDPEPG